MKIRMLVLLLLCGLTTAFAAGSEPDPVVMLPPFRVDEFTSYLGFAWNAVLKEQKITYVRFSRVEQRSLSGRAGLMENDRLVAIDGHPLRGLTVPELQQLFARNWNPGDTLTWIFTIERGALFPRQQNITLKVRTRAPADGAEKK
jgi:hypothetical protein